MIHWVYSIYRTALTQLHIYLEPSVYLNSAEFPAFVQTRKRWSLKNQQWQEIKQFLLEMTELWVSLSQLHLMTHQLSVICLVCDCCTGFITEEEWDVKVWSHWTTEDRFECVVHLFIIQQCGCCLLLYLHILEIPEQLDVFCNIFALKGYNST